MDLPLIIYQFVLALPFIFFVLLISFKGLRRILKNFYGFLFLILISLFLGGYWGYGWAVGTDMVMGGFWGYEGYSGIDWDGTYWSLYGGLVLGVPLLAVYLLIVYWTWLKNHLFWMGSICGIFIFGFFAIAGTLYSTLDIFLFYLLPFKTYILQLNRWWQIPIIFGSILIYSFLTGKGYKYLRSHKFLKFRSF